MLINSKAFASTLFVILLVTIVRLAIYVFYNHKYMPVRAVAFVLGALAAASLVGHVVALFVGS